MLVQTDAIQAELERILSSRGFSSSPRLGRFLRYCVEQSLDGRFEELKESMIGVNVFDRPPGYDPKIDPIVRVHAGRLREKLGDVLRGRGPSGNRHSDTEGRLRRLLRGILTASARRTRTRTKCAQAH